MAKRTKELESSKNYATESDDNEEQKGKANETENQQRDATFSELGVQTETSIIDGVVLSKVVAEEAQSSDEYTNSTSDDQPGPSSYSEIGRIQVDAVHPLFMGYRNKRRKVSTGTSTEEDKNDLCYCEQCKSYFFKSIPNIVEHFVNIYHKPDNKCVYCDGPVYYYHYNKKRDVYHKCHKDHVESVSLNGKSENNNNDVTNS